MNWIDYYRELYKQPYRLVDPKDNPDALRPTPEAMEWMLDLLATQLEDYDEDDLRDI